jgi:hypothetical protein
MKPDEDEAKYYVYHIINPITNRIFYIGKGCGSRCKQHLTDKKEYAFNKRLNGYIRNLIDDDNIPIITKVAENLNEEEAYLLEESQIKEYGRVGFDKDGILLNILESGRPPSLKGENHPWWGKKHSEESKKKMSETKKKMYASEMFVHPQKGKPLSEETKAKLSKANTGKKHTKESIEKTRQANLGRPQTDFQKQRAREANQKKWLVITPEGKEEIIINLRKYCRENNLDQGNMTNVAHGKLRQYKGYKVFKIED